MAAAGRAPGTWSTGGRGCPVVGARPVVEVTATPLVEVGSDQSAAALIAALQHGHRAVRAFAAQALGRLGVAAAVDALDARAKVEGDGWVKNEIAGALRALATRDDLADLVDTALPPGTPARLSAFEGLALLEAERISRQSRAFREP